MENCPICSTACKKLYSNFDIGRFECIRCGTFEISHMACRTSLRTATELQRWILSHAIRSMQHGSDQPCPRLWDKDVVSILQERRQLPAPPETCSNLVLWLGKQSPLANSINYAPWLEVAAIIGTSDEPDGVSFALQACIENEWVRNHESTPGMVFKASLTLKGWQEFERLQRTETISRRAFMAMSFRHQNVRDAFNNCFKDAVSSAGFELRILTDGQPAGLIDDQLRVAMRTSRFVVADLTHGNQGAYWEAGFSEGLGRPVFYTCEKTWFDDKEKGGTHFDTNHLNTVVWEHGKWGDAAQRLTAMIRATLPSEAKMTHD